MKIFLKHEITDVWELSQLIWDSWDHRLTPNHRHNIHLLQDWSPVSDGGNFTHRWCWSPQALKPSYLTGFTYHRSKQHNFEPQYPARLQKPSKKKSTKLWEISCGTWWHSVLDWHLCTLCFLVVCSAKAWARLRPSGGWRAGQLVVVVVGPHGPPPPVWPFSGMLFSPAALSDHRQITDMGTTNTTPLLTCLLTTDTPPYYQLARNQSQKL